MSLTPSQVEQFCRDGYVVQPGVLSHDDMVPIRTAIAAIIDREARRLHGEGRLADLRAGESFETRLARISDADEEVAREIYGAVLGKGGGGFSGPEMFAMLRHEGLLSCVASLVGDDIVGSSVYRIRPKMPGWPHGEVPWHQDSGYFLAHCDAHLIVTCWIPLVDATLENGCLHVRPSRHRDGIFRHFTGGHGGFLEIPREEFGTEAGDAGVIPLEMKAGDVLFMTNLTPHASFENRTDRIRWSVDLRYQGAEAPTNAEEDPESYVPERDEVTMACYPPEADFVVRDTANPAREVHSAEVFQALRKRYERARPHNPGRGWTPLKDRPA